MQVLEDQELKSQPEPLVVKVRTYPPNPIIHSLQPPSLAHGSLRSMLENYGVGAYSMIPLPGPTYYHT